jgi:hypothetical protein
VKEKIMEKKCIYCNDPLDMKLHGLTKYCSARCRNKDYYVKRKLDISQPIEYDTSEEKLPESFDNSPIEQNNIIGNFNSIRPSYEQQKQVQNTKEELYIPETYKVILDEKSKNFELLSKIHMLEFKNEELTKKNNILESENSALEIELEQNDDKEGQIFGMPKGVIENILVQVLSPHAGKIIDGFTKKD